MPIMYLPDIEDLRKLFYDISGGKIMYEIQDEDLGEKALKVAERKVKYLKNKKISHAPQLE